eukprot:jgi/Undpi1/11728/HiC_scaffold_37.g14023.m1
MAIEKFSKVLCANRGEIALRVFRACTELGLRTVAIFSEADARMGHRYKADESYAIGAGKRPVDAYLGIEEILQVAETAGVDAIHPGYGFLSENPVFADACRERGVAFIGPRGRVIELLGDKVRAKEQAVAAGVPVVPGMTLAEGGGLAAAQKFLDDHGPILVKAAHGGGGRGMRIVEKDGDVGQAIAQAQSESQAAFGSPEVFVEKFLPRVRHIEVQVLGDLAGNIVHLFERDCSVQRRHQKVIEVAPAPNLPEPVRQALWRDSVKLAKAVGYHNAGTVEFLVSGDQHYFIEVNPRLQVEHTVTEEITGIDLVQSQILVESGYDLASPQIQIFDQASIQPRGAAIQCRVTTEDPANLFLPDTGTIAAYRAPGGFGIRLDGPDCAPGSKVSTAYDSLLVKVTTHASDMRRAADKGLRALREFRIRGVKTNLPFLMNVLQHDHFLRGKTYTRFIDETPALFDFAENKDRATRLLQFLGDVIVNGHDTVAEPERRRSIEFLDPPVPEVPAEAPPEGTTAILEERGAQGLAAWVREQQRPLITDTTMRDAHQSLLATRVRTVDMLRIAGATAHLASELFSLETWGGATFDVAYRFLREDPWQRLRQLKAAAPNLLQQMLLRGANAVGYTSYPENVVRAFIDEAARAGIDVFRVFDSLNDLDNMQVAVEQVIATGKVAEVCICYTGDVDNPHRRKYSLSYYADLARRLQDMGTHILCVKDMAGLLRPEAARKLVRTLREAVDLPIHLHTHDTSGNGVAMLLAAIEEGVDIVDAALAPMAGMTSQPSINALVAALRGSPRETTMGNKQLQPLADYWEVVREFYSPFECGLKSSTSEVYYHEIPGGQYSNLRPQVASLGLLGRWKEVVHAFAVVNQLVGDIPKVTPSSKMVGDFAIFLVQNELLVLKEDLEASVDATRSRILAEIHRLDFPQSVVQYFQGYLGTPPGGFPGELRRAILKGLPVLEGLPSDGMEPLDLGALREEVADRVGRIPQPHEVVSMALYPRVVADYYDFRKKHGDVSILSTPVFLFGLEPGQEVWVTLEEGKTLLIGLDTVGELKEDGTRTVYFRLNGAPRHVEVRDLAVAGVVIEARKADSGKDGEVGAPMPGTVLEVHVAEGQEVVAGDPLLTLEAMKMETVVRAPIDGAVAEVCVDEKAAIQGDDLLVVIGDAD